MTSIAIDFGGTRVKLALIENGDIIREQILPAKSEVGLKPRLDEIEKIVLSWIQTSTHPISGIGIAFAGLVDPINKRVLSVNGKYEDATTFDFSAWCKKKFNLPFIMENDANAAILGEVFWGCAKGYSDAVIMILGTGVGTSAVMNGKLVRGRHFQAGCLGGHFSVSQSEQVCTCGRVGCVEANASTWALPIIAKDQTDFDQSGLCTEEKIDFLALEKWVLRKDKLALRLLEQCNHYWSLCIKNLVHAYDPEVVILSGGVLKCGEMIVKPLTQKVRNLVWTPWGEIVFKVAENTEHSVLLGLHHLIQTEGLIGRNGI